MTVGLDELYGLGYKNYLTTDDKYRAVTLGDIQRVVRRYFSDQPNAVAVVRPTTKAN